jgi:phage terminase large subunit-like protein
MRDEEIGMVDVPLEQLQMLKKLQALSEQVDRKIAARAGDRPRPWHKRARAKQLAPNGDWNIWLVLAGRGWGKATSLETLIPTPSGWTKMGDVAVGDEVFDESGRVCRVTDTFDVQATTAYRLYFSDSTTLDVCGEHQWVTWTHAERKAFLRSPYEDTSRFPAEWPAWRLKRQMGTQLPCDAVEEALALVRGGLSVRKAAAKLGVCRQALAKHISAGRYVPREPVIHVDSPGPRIRTTQEIVDTLTQGSRGDTNHCIPTAGALQLPAVDLPVDPYVLGVWLGDGRKGNGSIASHLLDQPEMRSVFEAVGYVTTTYKDPVQFGVLRLSTDLRRAGVLFDKHVPAVYLRASEDQRLDLLRGLMDTDGYCGDAHVEFCNTNPRLVEAVVELARSLGQKPTVAEGRAVLDGRDCGPKWRVKWKPTIQVFRLRRKADRLAEQLGGAQALRNHHRMIVKAEPIPAQPMRCITVDSKHSMYLAGEAMIPTHNTDTGANWIAEQAARNPGTDWAIIAPTWRDCRNTCLTGPSGLLKALMPDELESMNASDLTVRLKNGSRVYGYSADGYQRLRGANLSGAWVDEAAVMASVDDMFAEALMPALRIGLNPRVLITTTPRCIDFLRKLLARTDGSVAITRGATWENADNLSISALAELRARYDGTRLGKQELEGEIVEEVEGALWSHAILDSTRVDKHPHLARIVVGVDPAVTSGDRSDDTGIVVVGRSHDGHLYVLEDATTKGTPNNCMAKAIGCYHRWHADRIVGEVNNGGDYIESVIRAIDPSVAYKSVRATRGKHVRAQPISALWEQGRGHIVKVLATLEDQMCLYTDDTKESPDNLDAMIWGATDLNVGSSAMNYLASISRICGCCDWPNPKTFTTCSKCGEKLDMDN